MTPWLVDVTSESRLDHTGAPWPDGRYAIPEISAAGVALLDFDADGDLDIYQVIHPPPDRPNEPAPNRLWRREPDGRYREVEGAAGLADTGYGNGVAVGDIDGDGREDVFVANLGEDALYRARGDGTFERVFDGLQGETPAWSTSAAFFDADRDGDLDLYVCRYLVDDPGRVCRPRTSEPRDYCGPRHFRGVRDTLWRNEGGRFADATEAAGLAEARPGFGVICADLTADGILDIYVANDQKPNQLWVGRGDGTFRDEAPDRGLALNGAGVAEAGMGVAVGDVDGDGLLDVLLTHLVDETNTLYIARRDDDGTVRFDDRSARSGVGAPSRPLTGWGCGLVDLDLDGALDVALVNGRVVRGPPPPASALGEFWSPYAEPGMLLVGDGGGAFREERALAGAFAERADVHRSLAFGDLDGDGDVDLVASTITNGLRIWRNDAPRGAAHWVALRPLRGARVDAGALVELHEPGRRRVALVTSAGSFAAASEPLARFAVREASTPLEVAVRWTDGAVETFDVEAVDRIVDLRRGEGRDRVESR